MDDQGAAAGVEHGDQSRRKGRAVALGIEVTDTGRVDCKIREVAGVGAMHCCARVVMASGRAEVGSATPDSVNVGSVEARGEAADMDVHVEDPVGVLRE